MNFKVAHFILLIVAIVALAAGVWAVARLMPERATSTEASTIIQPHFSDPDLWARSLAKVQETRSEELNVALEIPPQVRHYEERRWFLATQVAEVKKFNLQPVQDFVDLAAVIHRGDLVSLPAVTDTYILFGVGARVDGDAFTRFVANQNLELTDEAGLQDAYARLESERAKIQKDLLGLRAQHRSDLQQDELEIEIRARQQELKSIEEDQALINRYYALTGSGPRLLRDFDSLQALAKRFGGRTFNLDDSSERRTLKVYLLSSIRPPALKVLEEVARRYSDKFGRPLPVSSLIRPEQYQHALRRVNRYAAVIDTPPHSTGLAFDINYRYMSTAEQNFLMNELARMKDEGRIEVLRERGANFHVFAFIDGQRPSDELVTASLDEVGPATKEDNAEKSQLAKTARVETKLRAGKNSRPPTKATRTTSKKRAKR